MTTRARGFRRGLVPSLPLLSAVLLSLLGCAGKGSRAPAASPSERVAAAAAAPAGPKAADPADVNATAPMPIDPAIRLGQLDNGLRYFVRAHGKPEHRAALRLVVDVGSVLEADDQRGLAHFIEHMAFNGTKLFPKNEIVEYFEKVGMRFGSDANASTSFDETIYTFTVPTDDTALLDKAFVILEQMAHEVAFDPGEVDRERGVILEERRLGLGASMRVLEQIIPVLFKGSIYADRIPIGTLPVLQKATAADLRKFYQRWYRPDLMAVAAVGDFDAAAVERSIRKVFNAIPKPTTPAGRTVNVVPEQPETLVAIGQDAELPSSMVGVVHKMPRRPEASEGDYRRRIVENLYHLMLNGRLEEQARSKDAPFLFAASATQELVRPVEIFAEVAGVRQDGFARGLEALTREVERVDRHGFTAGELARAKAEQLRQMQSLAEERQNLPADSFADEMVRHFLTGEAMPGIEAELRLHDRYLPTVQVAEMNAIARDWLGERDRVIMVQAPQAATVPSRDALVGILRGVERAPIPPYVDRVANRPLVPALPAGGRIERTSEIAAIGVTEWRLGNGVRVVWKPTDWKRDEVLLAAFSPGGTSLVPERDYRSALFAAQIVGGSGWGGFDPTELRNALAGKLVDVAPYIDELEEGILGKASPQDLETMLQLVYLAFTAPRRDDGVFAAFRTQLQEQLAHRDVDPDAVFADRRQEVLYANHPRRRPLEPGDEKRVSLDRVMEIYRARFANAADFTFVITGSARTDTLGPLVAKYLGALPSRPGSHETWRDVGVRPVAGIQRFEVKKGVEPKSDVSLTFTGAQRWTRREDHLLDSLVEALGIRLREVLREGMSGVYNVGVTGDLQRRPREEFQTSVAFGCAPENVDGLVAATLHELDEARRGKLAPAYADKVRAAQRRALEQSQRNNGYWLGQLVDHYRYGTDPTLILREGELIEDVTPARLAEAAARYFSDKRYVMGVLRPASPAVSSTAAPGKRPSPAPAPATAAPAGP
jgi:zinc protease